jgi:glycosyltransferase involved in cell wall biosynthesis
MGHEVTFVEMPSVRAALRLGSPLPAMGALGGRPAAREGIRVVRLLPLPGYLRMPASALARRWAGRAARRLGLGVPSLGQAVLVVSTPWWVPVVRGLARGLLLYDYIDHVSVHAGTRHAGTFAAWDAELLSLSDAVVAVSEALRQDIARRAPSARVFLIPNGVDQRWVDAPVQGMPRDRLTSRPDRPIAGFLGALFEWVDVALLADTARALPEVEFVLVGPRRRGVGLGALRALPNVRCFPAQPYHEVPRWIRSFDVCLIPFKKGVIGACADPIKLYEYSALGKPIVSTLEFPRPGDAPPVTVASTRTEFAEAIQRAVRDPGAERARRIAFARNQTWQRRASDLLAAASTVLRASGRRAPIAGNGLPVAGNGRPHHPGGPKQ